MKLFCIQIVISRQFSQLGSLVARCPLYFIMVPIIITAILSTGFLRNKVNRDKDSLLTASNWRASRNKLYVQTHYPMDPSTFVDVSRQIFFNETNVVMVTAKDGGTILREEIFREVKELDEAIMNITVNHKGAFLGYKDLCARRLGKCQENDIISLIPNIKEIIAGKYKLKYPFEINEITFSYKQYVHALGGVSVDDRGYMEDAKAIRLFYMLNTKEYKNLEAVYKWQEVMNDVIQSREFSYINRHVINQLFIDKEIGDIIDILVRKLPIVIFVVVIFSSITCMTNNLLRSKPWLGPCTCVAAGMAVISAFGLVRHLGIENVDANIALAYVILATEIDDSFVLIAAWRGTKVSDNVEKRMKTTYSEAAVSITITSSTNFLAYTIGIANPFPGVKIFCIYAAVCIIFSYVYQLTFFGACLAIDGYREERQLNPFTFRPLKDSAIKTISSPSKRRNEEEYIMVQFREKIGALLSHNWMKILIMLIFLVNLGIGVWGTTFIKYGTPTIDILSPDAELTKAQQVNYKYFSEYSYPLHIIFDEPLDYSDPKVQLSIEELVQKFEKHPHVCDSSLRISWLKYYLIFSSSRVGKFILSGYNISEKQQFIDSLRNVFLRFPQAREFQEDIIFNDNHTEIISSRFLIPLTKLRNFNVEVATMNDLYKIVDQSNMPVRIHSFLFHLYEQAIIIRGITIEIGLLTTAITCMIFFLFIPKFTHVLCISFVVLCTVCETVGYMSWWKINLDIASLTSLIICVGFSINYPTHLSFSFLMAGKSDGNERIKKAVYSVGLPIFQGSITTVLGVIVMAFEKYYAAKCFFSIVFIIASITAFHSLLVIPVILSILLRCDDQLPLTDTVPGVEEVTGSLTELGSTNDVKCQDVKDKLLKANG